MAALVAALLAPVSISGQTKAKPQNPPKQHDLDLNTLLMKCTFEIKGQNPQGKRLLGTAFIMGRPIPGIPKRGRYVLITAAHVLEGMPTDTPTLVLRRNLGKNRWVPDPIPITIRTMGHPLWTQPPDADVAVMYVTLPTNVKLPLISTKFLAGDSMLSRFEIHPGDELECLGYPLGATSNAAGFPILRSGRIASYPLLPTATFKTFLFDFRVFNGNSGGPVYFVQSNRTYGGRMHLGQTVGFIAGLVSEQRFYSQRMSSLYQEEIQNVPLDLAVVVDASLIKQAIDMLPQP